MNNCVINKPERCCRIRWERSDGHAQEMYADLSFQTIFMTLTVIDPDGQEVRLDSALMPEALVKDCFKKACNALNLLNFPKTV
jgi:hypothetical protein